MPIGYSEGSDSGSWSIYSKKDPHWRAYGTSEFVGGFKMPRECKEKLQELKKLYGEPPDDLEWSYMKD